MSKLHRTTLLALAAVCAVLLSGALASLSLAATAGGDGRELVIQAGSSEEVSILAYLISTDLVVRTTNVANMDARAGCTQVTSKKVRCQPAEIRVQLSGRSDTFGAGPVSTDDGVSVGTPFRISIFGESGNDSLQGGNREDIIIGGPDDDKLVGGASPDLLYGGPGQDLVSYEDRNTTGPGVTIILPAPAGTGPDGDFINNDVEGAIGTSFGDTITGNPGANDLRGQSLPSGARAPDTINGGDGNDTIDARGGQADNITCGPGADRALLDLVDAIRADCESISQAAVGQHPNVVILQGARVVRHRRALRPRLRCPRASRRTCKGTLTLRDRAGRSLGRQRFSIGRGKRQRLTIGLNERGRRAVAAGTRITAVANEKDTNGRPKTTITRLSPR